MGIISLALQLSMLPLVVDGTGIPEIEPWQYVLIPGTGASCQVGDLVTVDYRIEDETGKEIANSEIRGVPMTFQVGTPTSDALLSAAVETAQVGEERLVMLLREDWYPSIGQGSLIPPGGPLLVRLRLTKVVRR